MFDISTLFFSWFTLLKLECVLYTRAFYMLSNTVICFVNSVKWYSGGEKQTHYQDQVEIVLFGSGEVGILKFNSCGSSEADRA